MAADDATEWVVREAVDDDAAAIGAFLRAIWDEAGPDAPGFAGATAELIDEIAAPAAVRARLGGPERRMVLALHGVEVIGFAATRASSATEAELAGIVVRRAWAGRGIGRELVSAALGMIGPSDSVVVRTEVDNVAAIRFYESLGFRREGTATELVDDVPVPVVELVRRPDTHP